MSTVAIPQYVDATNFANLAPNVYGVPVYYTISANTIKVWPTPSTEALSAGLIIQISLGSSMPSVLSPTVT